MGRIGAGGLGLLVILVLSASLAASSPAAPLGVVTWGQGGNGQLGNGTGTGSDVPVGVCAVGATAPCTAAKGNLLTGVTAVAAEGVHGLALLGSETVVAWGYDGFGELGDGSTGGHTNVPVGVCEVGATAPCTAAKGNLLKGVTAISNGVFLSMALLGDGTVVTWGNNDYGQLGDGATGGSSDLPVRVCAVGATAPCTAGNGNLLKDVVAISTSASEGAIALLGNGSVVAWGRNEFGQLGDGTVAANSDVPVEVCAVGATAPCTAGNGNVLTDVTSISGGLENFDLARLGNETAVSWGEDNVGQLGNGETGGGGVVPVEVCAEGATAPCTAGNGNVLTGVAAVAAADYEGYALLDNSTAVSWGDNTAGQLGEGTSGSTTDVPAGVCEVGGTAPCTPGNGNLLSGIHALSGGIDDALALMNNEIVDAWGWNGGEGALGNGTIGGMSDVPAGVCEVEATAPCTTGNGNVLSAASAVSAGWEFDAAIHPVPTASGEPHWYSDGKLIVGEVVPVATKGKLTLHGHGGELEVVCKVKDQETIENPAGGGAGLDTMTSFTLSGCKATREAVCPRGEKLEVHANAPWKTKLLAGPPIRDEIVGMQLTLVCKKRGVERVVNTLSGSLTPEVGNSTLEFASGSGQLAESPGAGTVTVTGTDSLKGPKKDRTITASTP